MKVVGDNKYFFITEVLDSEHKGWVEVKIDDLIFRKLPYSTKVELLEETSKYQRIKILDGYFKDHYALLPYQIKKNNTTYSYLSSKLIYNPNLILKLKANTLLIGGVEMKVIFDLNNIKKGIYNIKFPILTTKKMNNYFLEMKGGSRFAESWFPITIADELYIERYIHFGTYSYGCVTVKYDPTIIPGPWQLLFITLMTSRKSNNVLANLIIE